MALTPCPSIIARDSSTGNKAASVLPEPVGATTKTSEPSTIAALAESCIRFSWTISLFWSNCFEIDAFVGAGSFDGKPKRKVPRVNKVIPESGKPVPPGAGRLLQLIRDSQPMGRSLSRSLPSRRSKKPGSSLSERTNSSYLRSPDKRRILICHDLRLS